MAPRRGLSASEANVAVPESDAPAAAPAKAASGAATAAKLQQMYADGKENASAAVKDAVAAVRVFQRRNKAAAAATAVQTLAPADEAAPPAPAGSAAAAWLRASLARRASLASDSGASASAESTDSGADADAASEPDAAAPPAAALPGVATKVAAAVAASAPSAAESRLERARAKASKLSRALEARARAALAERAAYFAALDEESLEEASPGSVATSARPPRPDEADDEDADADIGAVPEATPQRQLSAIFGAAAARAAAAVEAVKAEVKAQAAALPSPGGGGGGIATPGATPERAVARTSAWVRGLPARFSLGGVSRIAEETDDDAAEAEAEADALSDAAPDSAQRDSSAGASPDSAKWPSSEEASATASVSDDASPSAAGAAAPALAPQQPRTSLGLSRRASLGFAERVSGGVGRRSSVAGAPPRVSLAGVRRLSVADDAAAAAAPLPPRPSLPGARRGSGAPMPPPRASMAPGRQSLAPFAAIAEAEDDDASELAEDDGDADVAVAEAEEEAAEAAAAEPLPRTPLRADALGTALRRASMRASLAAAGVIDAEDAETEVDAADEEPVAFPEDFEDAASVLSDAPSEPLCALDGLLRLCGQSSADVLPMADALARWLKPAEAAAPRAKPGAKGTTKAPAPVRKLGEGTYGEAFKCPGVVLKVVPMGGEQIINGTTPKEAEHMRAEASMSLSLSRLRDGLEPGCEDKAALFNATAGFVRTEAVVVTRGPYAPVLLDAWNEFKARPDKQSENDFPGQLPDEQLYCVFVLSDGGGDLESFELRDAAEARALLLQVALSLAVAEEACEFEHRDLHWGNVLLARAPCGPDEARHTLRGVRVAAATEGLAVTLIDFTLSRMTPRDRAGMAGPIAFCNLEDDPDIFKGPKGECQFETYRRMRRAVRADWAAYAPRTNALWLHYLADCVLTAKKFPCDRAERRALQAFRQRCAEKHRSASDAVTDEIFATMWRAL